MQVGQWLGFVIDTIAMKFFLPEKELSNLKGLLHAAISDSFCTYRFLAKIAGSVISSALAVGPIAHLLTCQIILLLKLDHRGILSSFSPPPFSRSLNFGILTWTVLTVIQFHLLLHLVLFSFAMQAS